MASPRSEAFAARLAGQSFDNLRRLQKSAVSAVFTADVGDFGVVVRQPPDAESSHRVHDALLLLAEDAGVGEWLMPSTVADMHDRVVMITERAPASFLRSDLVATSLVSEPARVTGAFLDVLCAHRDRIAKNLLLSPEGDVRLIDNDDTFGLGPVWHNRRSVFLPGEALAFASAPATPAWVEALLSHDLVQRYGLLAHEAALLRTRAQLIVSQGLRAADAAIVGLQNHMTTGAWRMGERLVRLHPNATTTDPQLAHWHLHAYGADWRLYFLDAHFAPALCLTRESDDVWVGSGLRLARDA